MRFVRCPRRLRAGDRAPARPARQDALSEPFRRLLDQVSLRVLPDKGVTDTEGLIQLVMLLSRYWETGEGGSPAAVIQYLVEQHGWMPGCAGDVALAWQVVFLLRHLLEEEEG
jgi:hypothetical protein